MSLYPPLEPVAKPELPCLNSDAGENRPLNRRTTKNATTATTSSTTMTTAAVPPGDKPPDDGDGVGVALLYCPMACTTPAPSPMIISPESVSAMGHVVLAPRLNCHCAGKTMQQQRDEVDNRHDVTTPSPRQHRDGVITTTTFTS